MLPPGSSGFLATAVADTLLGCLLAVGRVYHLFMRRRRELWAFTPTRFTSSN